jgi:hypothetical protein
MVGRRTRGAIQKIAPRERENASLRAQRSNPGRLEAIGVIADCDNSPNGRLDTIVNCGKAFGFESCRNDLFASGRHVDGNRRLGVSLSPRLGIEGRIEGLILREKAEDETMKCVSQSLECISNANGRRPVDEKAQVQMFISAVTNSSMAGIRQAFGAGTFDVTHTAYAEHLALVDFILG